MRRWLLAFVWFLGNFRIIHSQQNSIFEHLPVGKFAVGLRIITLADDSRVDKPAINYLGEKNQGDLRRHITIHLWYPCVPSNANYQLKYGDYCYNDQLKSSSDSLSTELRNNRLESARRSVENWFGKTSDNNWENLINAHMLAQSGATAIKGPWPLLIGILRPLSTAITNEILASNGFVVAMISSGINGSFAEAALFNIQDMRFAIASLQKEGMINEDIGAFGFSGSGFSQVLFAMSDFRVKALADIESGIYMDELFQALALSNYYNPAKLRVPFLHIFSLDLSKQEKYFSEFESKSIFSSRYRLLLNQPKLHHWDFASEGFTASIFLDNRGSEKNNIRLSFEIACTYLLVFFEAILKRDERAVQFLGDKSVFKNLPSTLWDISYYPGMRPPPDRDELEHNIRVKGIDTALGIVNQTIRRDSSDNLWQWYVLNSLGYNFLNEGNYSAAIGIFRLNTELHPDDANLFDSLGEAYERSGDKENMKKMAANVINLLARKPSLNNNEKNLQHNAEKRLRNQ